uniref:Uncharacterized protein n=1 Tax=Anguilla anguilla TaxID=7936 RepID=A0A0E9T2E4_ANGAN
MMCRRHDWMRFKMTVSTVSAFPTEQRGNGLLHSAGLILDRQLGKTVH